MSLQSLYDWIFHQNSDGSGLSLKATGVVLGVLLLVKHLLAWLKPKETTAHLKTFPRDRAWGVILLTIAFVWSFFLVTYMDMGEFYTLRRWLLIIVPVTYVLMLLFVPEFLAVRALGTLLLLVASPVLHAAFLEPYTSRLLISVLAYAWIIGGMFLIGMPYLLRDGISWVTQSESRFRLAALGGATYGGAILVAALLIW